MKRFIIYHDDADGRCAAAISGRHAEKLELMPVYIPVDYGNGLPIRELESAEYSNDECWILDFSWPRPEMEWILGKFLALTWIDHHKTAIEKLAPISSLMGGIQNNDMAACFLTWHFINGGIHTPVAVRLIADHDTWAFDLGNDSHYFHEALQLYSTHPREPVWNLWLNIIKIEELRNRTVFLETGKILYDAKIRNFQRLATIYGREEKIFGTNQKMLSINHMGDGDLGDVINRMGYDVAHCYIDQPNGRGLIRQHRLYSKTVDVGAIAAKHAGGGHEHAAGWTEKIG